MKIEQAKYYYTDPLKVAWMNKHHDLKTIDSFEICDEYDAETGVYYNTQGLSPDKIWVHPDSYEILEPQSGDLVMVNYPHPEPNNYGILEKTQKDIIVINALGRDNNLVGMDIAEIIQREGIAFFAPEID